MAAFRHHQLAYKIKDNLINSQKLFNFADLHINTNHFGLINSKSGNQQPLNIDKVFLCLMSVCWVG